MPTLAVAAGLGAGFAGLKFLQGLLQRAEFRGDGLQALLTAAEVGLDLLDPCRQLIAALLQGAMGPLGGRAFGLQGGFALFKACLLYTSPSPRDLSTSRMPSSA